MARPIIGRRICALPENERFGPLGVQQGQREFTNMTVDEYECIRLIDYEGFTQEEASQHMGVARTTVQGIYARARRKISLMIVEGKSLTIGGGQYIVCHGPDDDCGPGCGKRRRRARRR